jgi:hypothetical protein
MISHPAAAKTRRSDSDRCAEMSALHQQSNAHAYKADSIRGSATGRYASGDKADIALTSRLGRKTR